jgi:threonine dehydrogenase-like Zn-dependent dehydrogenase
MRVGIFEKQGVLRLATKDLRSLREDEVLVRVESCGICGTDLHIVDGTSRSSPPVVLGHEYAGEVEDVGRGVQNPEIRGRRVAVDPNISCGRCFYCRRGLVHLCRGLRALGVDLDGGMAEYSIVPEAQIHLLPKEMDPDAGALVEPISCVVHGIDRAHIQPGDTVVILGGGTVGLIMLQLARNAGAARTMMVEPVSRKRDLAIRFGANSVMDPGAGDVRKWIFDTTEVGADVVIECAGRPETMELSLQLARRGGTVEFFGVCPIGASIPVEPNAVYAKELTIVGSYVNPHTFTRAAALLQSEAVRAESLSLEHFPLDGLHEAFAALREGRTLKSMIHPSR